MEGQLEERERERGRTRKRLADDKQGSCNDSKGESAPWLQSSTRGTRSHCRYWLCPAPPALQSTCPRHHQHPTMPRPSLLRRPPTRLPHHRPYCALPQTQASAASCPQPSAPPHPSPLQPFLHLLPLLQPPRRPFPPPCRVQTANASFAGNPTSPCHSRLELQRAAPAGLPCKITSSQFQLSPPPPPSREIRFASQSSPPCHTTSRSRGKNLQPSKP